MADTKPDIPQEMKTEIERIVREQIHHAWLGWELCAEALTERLTSLHTKDTQALWEKLAALEAENAKLARLVEIKTKTADRYLPCPDCRDKVKPGECLRCANQTLARVLSSSRAENVCDACAGTGKPVSGKPCMCRGTGRMSEAARWLREQLVEREAEVERLTKERDEAVSSLTGTTFDMAGLLDRCERAEKALALAESALGSLWAAIGDRLLAKGPLAKEYANSVAREVESARAAARASLSPGQPEPEDLPRCDVEVLRRVMGWDGKPIGSREPCLRIRPCPEHETGQPEGEKA